MVAVECLGQDQRSFQTCPPELQSSVLTLSVVLIGFFFLFFFTIAKGFLSSQALDQRDQGMANSFHCKESQSASFKMPKHQTFKIIK